MNIVGYKIAPVLAVAVLLATPTPSHAFFQEVKSEFRYQGASVWQAVLDPLADMFEPWFAPKFTPPASASVPLPPSIEVREDQEGKEQKEVLIVNNPQTLAPSKQEILSWIKDILKLQNTSTYTSPSITHPPSVPLPSLNLREGPAQVVNQYITNEYRTSGSSQGLADSLSHSLTNIDSRFTQITNTLTNSYTFLSPSLTNATLTGETTIDSHLLMTATSAPSITTNRLYNAGGDLYWAGSLIGGATTGNWTSDGTNVWRAGGSIGVGTSSPWRTLSINGSSDLGTNALAGSFTATSSTASIFPYASSTSLTTTGYTALATGGGNVGIGTTAPGSALSVVGAISSTAFTSGYVPKASAGGVLGDSIIQQQGAAGANVYIKAMNTSTSVDTAWQSGDGTNNVFSGLLSGTCATTGVFTIYNGGCRVNVLSDGNVGIGTTSPSAKLELLKTGSSYQQAAAFYNTTADGIPYITLGKSAATDSGLNIGYHNTDNYGALWITGDNPTVGAGLILANGGNVGIGTTGPGSKLEITTSGVSDGAALLAISTGDGVTVSPAWIKTPNLTTGHAAELNIGVASSPNNRGNLSFNYVGAGSALNYMSLGFYGTGSLFSVLASGNVGIGTTGPGSKLEVSGDIGYSAASALYPRTKTVTDWYLGKYVDANPTYSVDNAIGAGYEFRIGKYVSSTFTPNVSLSGGGSGINSYINSGNVGIGTTGPGNKLDVRSTVTAPGAGYKGIATLYSTDALGTDVGAGLLLGGVYTGSSVTEFAQVAGVKENATNANYAGALTFHTRTNGLGTMPERMRIDSSGNVGIGTTTPGDLLSTEKTQNALTSMGLYNYTNGTAARTIFTVQSANVIPFIQALSPSNTAVPAWANAAVFGSNSDVFVGPYTANSLYFQTGGAGTKRMTIDSNGYVGIGTTAPGNSLSVATAADSSSINVRGNAGTTGGMYLYSGAVTSGFTSVGAEKVAGTWTARATSASLFGGYTAGSAAFQVYGNSGLTSGNSFTPTELMRLSLAGGLSLGNSYVATDPGAGNMIISGNVGIGTTGPVNKLHVVGDANIQGQNGWNELGDLALLRFGNVAGSQSGIGAKWGGPDLIFSVYKTGGTGTFGTNSLDAMSIAIETGNVGIGTTNPVYRDQNGSADGAVKLAVDVTSTGRMAFDGSGTLVGMNLVGANSSSNYVRYAAINGNFVSNTAGGETGYLALFTKPAASAIQERLRIDSTGNVGIGTTGPGYKLEVNGTGYFGSTLSTNGAAGTPAVSFSQEGVTTNYTNRLLANFTKFGNMRANFTLINVTEDFGINVVTDGGVGLNAMTFQRSTGNVGIGTTSPSAKLAIKQGANTAAGGLWIAETGDTDFRSAFMDTSGILSFYGGDISGTLNTATLNAAGAWTNASDRSYKENIIDLGEKYGLDSLMQMQPRFYTMKGNNLAQVGFIAQELDLVIPEVVDGVEGSMGISYGNLVAVVVQAVKELNHKVDLMFASIKELVETRKLKTDKIELNGEFCVDDVCVTKDQLKDILLQSGATQYINPPSENTPEEPDPEQNPGEIASSTEPVILEEEVSTDPVIPEESENVVPESVPSPTQGEGQGGVLEPENPTP